MSRIKETNPILKTIQTIKANKSQDNEAEELGTMQKVLQNSNSVTINGAHHIAEVVRATLLEISAIKERNNERRHKELMNLIETILKSKDSQTSQFKNASDQMPVKSEEEVVVKEEFLDEDFVMEPTEDPIEIIETIQVARVSSIKNSSPDTSQQEQSSTHKTEYEIAKKQILEMHKKKMEDRLTKNQHKAKHLRRT